MNSPSPIQSLPNKASQPLEQTLVVGFYDLTDYMHWSAGQNPISILTYLDRFFEETGALITSGGGLFVKAIGDAGLFVFPGDTDHQIEHAVQTLQDLRLQTNQWLARDTKQMEVTVQMNWGRVACGPVGMTGDKKFDV